jgi:hypothetical protein
MSGLNREWEEAGIFQVFRVMEEKEYVLERRIAKVSRASPFRKGIQG